MTDGMLSSRVLPAASPHAARPSRGLAALSPCLMTLVTQHQNRVDAPCLGTERISVKRNHPSHET